jgi:DNA (cytosine-5)-methyltransferase 1
LRYLSVCSGIEAATVAWHDFGWEAAAYSEIEKFPSEVLKHHYPTVPNMGDMTKYKEWEIGTIGLLVGGTPCQSFSVAGLRKGLEDPRGNLALTYCGILDKFRPKWFIWENVPGVLSSGKGRDFGSFLGAVAQLGYGFSYRVLDAQYFGVAQRRRRVFVVGHLGDWRPTAKVLFESESLCRNTKKSRKSGEEVAGTLTARFGASRNNHEECVVDRVSKCLTTKIRNDYETEQLIAYASDKSATLTASGSGFSRPGGFSTSHENYVAIPIHAQATQFQGGGKNRNNDGKGNGLGIGKDGDPMNTLTTANVHAVAHAFKVRGGSGNGGKGYLGQDEQAFTLSTVQDQHIAVGSSDKAGTLRANPGSGFRSNGTPVEGVAIYPEMAVRRLTPVECERLQGFPDNYTNIKENCPDGPRYKALGNSMAVPVMRWIGSRIQMVEDGLI